jgi:hypothetical protein
MIAVPKKPVSGRPIPVLVDAGLVPPDALRVGVGAREEADRDPVAEEERRAVAHELDLREARRAAEEGESVAVSSGG